MRTFLLPLQSMPTAEEIKGALRSGGISLSSLLRIFEHRFPPNDFSALSYFFDMLYEVTVRHPKTGLFFCGLDSPTEMERIGLPLDGILNKQAKEL